MWNGMVKRLILMKLRFEWYLNVSVTVDSSVVRMVIGLANWVLGRIFGTGEREAESYVTGIVWWQQIVLGGLDIVREGRGVGELGDICWKFRRWEDNTNAYFYIWSSEMRYQLKSSVSVWKIWTQYNNQHHNINKSYVCEQWQAFWTWHWTVLFRNLYITWTLKTSPVALYCMQHRRNMRAVLSVGIVRRTSGQCGQHTAGLCGSDVRHLVIQKQQIVR